MALTDFLLHVRRRLVVVAALVLLAAGVAIAIIDPFATKQRSGNGIDNGAPTALQTVQRRALTAQQTLTGTLGYAGVWTVAIPAGTPAADLQQAAQQDASAQAGYATANTSVDADAQTAGAAEAALQAARLKEASDCAGANAAAAATSEASASPAPATPCATSMQTADADQQAAASAQQKLAADQAQLSAAQTTLRSARHALAGAQAASASYGGTSSFTMLPAVGDVVGRGRPLYAIDDVDTLLLYGDRPAWRSMSPGVSPGRDVAELNANLRALGYGAITGDAFTAATKQAVEALQRLHGLSANGELPLGSVVFEPGAARVTGVTPTPGQSVQPGPVITLSSTQHTVAIQLDAAEQSQVKVGNRVLVTLPDNSNTPGIVDYVGKVATTGGGQQANGGASSNSPTIPVNVRLLRPEDAGTLDQAPVNILITTASVRSALVVPVDALVALAGGGYAIEVVESSGTHQLVQVTPGLFDDEDGLVQIKGTGVAAGQRVVVPASS